MNDCCNSLVCTVLASGIADLASLAEYIRQISGAGVPRQPQYHCTAVASLRVEI